ncbi:MarR family winged helix-turn-helix transcriptional regulator [Paenibacillus sp. FSL K6-2524]|uniref:MarR family winged helix-turn-helix transcriptional regulator n=1 Tax=Paenibacillus sp. FSL K6-2524 TaxID=2954516 RepID=UPI0030F6FCD7
MRKKGLDHSIGFQLGNAHRKLSHLFMLRTKQYDITPEQWGVLYRVREEDGLIQREIAQRSGKDKPTTTRILDVLEAKGLITKQAGKSDRRSFHVFITEQGKLVADAIEPIEYRTVGDVLDTLTDEEYELMCTVLNKISQQATELATLEKE